MLHHDVITLYVVRTPVRIHSIFFKEDPFSDEYQTSMNALPFATKRRHKIQPQATPSSPTVATYLSLKARQLLSFLSASYKT